MDKAQVTKMDVLSVIDELAAKGEDGKATTKAIILRLGELFPDVHMKRELMIMGDLKREGYLHYKPSEMAWWLTAAGKDALKK
jgi:Mn-dependent DtxR family transcriptional regulator